MRRTLLAASLLGVVFVAGCVPNGGEYTEITFNGTIEQDGAGVRVTGEVSMGGPVTDEDVFEGVVVCLYSSDGQLLNRTSPQQLGPEFEPLEVTLTTQTTPRYLIINSSAFWASGDVAVAYYTVDADESQYPTWSGWAVNHEELPVQGCTG